MRIPILVITLASLANAQAQQVTVPASFDQADAPSVGFVGGVHMRMREQYLFDAGLLPQLAGKTMKGISFRRDAVQAFALAGGVAQIEVWVSTTGARVEAPSPSFAANHGLDRTHVFTGPVAVPDSPGVAASRWDPSGVVSIQFQTEFAYARGNLCVEISGAPDPLRPPAYWPFDYVRQDPGGAVTSHGQACGPVATLQLSVLDVERSSLAVGSTISVMNRGPVGSLGVLLLLGMAGGTGGVDLGSIGAPGCMLYVNPVLSVSFQHDQVPPVKPASSYAFGQTSLHVPGEAALLGGRFALQSATVEIAAPFTNALHLTTSELVHVDLAPLPLTLGQSIVSSGPVDAPLSFPNEGTVIPNRGPVVRFDVR